MPIQAFVAPQIGDGMSMETAFRSVVSTVIGQGENYNEYDHPGRRYSLVIVEASDATLDAITALQGVILCSPRAANRIEFGLNLNRTVSTFPAQFVSDLQTKLEAGGINTAWATGQTTLRQIIRYLIRVSTVAQLAQGAGNSNLLDFLARNLTATINQVPVPVRSAVSQWMQDRGLAIGWITNQTTVREVLHFIHENLNFSPINLDNEAF